MYIEYKTEKRTGIDYAYIRVKCKNTDGKWVQFSKRINNEKRLLQKNFEKAVVKIANDFQQEMDYKCSIPPKKVDPVEVQAQLEQIEDIKYDLHEREMKNRRVSALGIKSFTQLAAEWLDYVKNNYSPNYYVRGRRTIKLFNFYLVDIYMLNKPICDITVRQIQEFLRTQFEGQSVATVQGHRRILHAIFNEALRFEWISRNPVALTKVGSAHTPTLRPVEEKEIFSLTEARQFINILDAFDESKRNQRAIFKTILLTGVRTAEMMGLRWSDVDFERRIIHVRRNRLYDPSFGWYEKPPKTKTSIRSIPIPQELMDELTDFYAWYKEAVPDLDDRKDEFYLACTLERTPIFIKNLPKHLHRIEDWNGLKHVTPHGLRHTYCSILLANNVPIQTVSKYMGHSDSSITLRVYSHFIPESVDMVIDALDTAFDKPE